MSQPQDRTDSEQELVRKFFRQAEARLPEPSPFLPSRVMAELRGRQHGQRRLRFWQVFATSALFVVFGVVATRFLSPDSGFSALTGKPFVVRVDLEEIKQRQLEYASIELPAGVHFVSKEHPEIRSQNRIEIDLVGEMDLTNLPFVIESDSAGEKTIRIRFYGHNQHDLALAQREIKIHFRTDTQLGGNSHG